MPKANAEPLFLGQVCSKLGVTRNALHRWEKQGLLSPVRHKRTRVRQYTPEEVRKVRLISRYQAFGLKPGEIYRLFTSVDGHEGKPHSATACKRLLEEIAQDRAALRPFRPTH